MNKTNESRALSVPSGSAWASWSADELAREIRSRMKHFYGKTDGTMRFPNSAEGDLLKMTHALLEKPNTKISHAEDKL